MSYNNNNYTITWHQAEPKRDVMQYRHNPLVSTSGVIGLEPAACQNTELNSPRISYDAIPS
jgi:hypothetical protein